MKRFLLASAVSAGLLVVADPARTQTWVGTSAPTHTWVSIASSADGQKLVAVSSYDVRFHISTNAGAVWTPRGVIGGIWSSVASSADGCKLAVASAGVGYGGPIYLSSDSGASWTLAAVPLQCLEQCRLLG